MCSNNTHRSCRNRFTRNTGQVCDVLNYGVAAFFTWFGLFWFEITRKNFANAF
jgi:hypothetical protein